MIENFINETNLAIYGKDVIVCSTGMAALLFENKRFRYLENNMKSFLDPNRTIGSSYLVGYLGGSRIMVEPALEYNNMNIYDGRYKRIHTFNYKFLDLMNLLNQK